MILAVSTAATTRSTYSRVRAVLVQAIDASARSFYLRFGFSPSPIDEMRLMLLMKDLRAFLRTRKL